MLKNYLEEEKYEELKNSDNLIYKALELATILFENDNDKGGFPYLFHLMNVYKNVNKEDEKVVALLHDIIEDKDVTDSDLIEIGFPKKIVDDVIILTRDKTTDYSIYIDNLLKNGSSEALNVKLADIINNMDMKRIKNPSITDYERLEKRYQPAYEKILNKINEMNKGA